MDKINEEFDYTAGYRKGLSNGRESRDEEINILKKDVRHFVEMNNNLAKILDDKVKEIKKLRDNIEHLKLCLNRTGSKF